ncbi:right-handed parallel beta-helix repeat-containing protein [Gilvimarinus sp. SDUM040013]|uniref:Right-handed parallel beta-helix repeat-containing protein n=1 Tax=Gilvimarinus gilvus TaxID=3058038 RepID=A0ABU4RXY7_9GAMM|nr:right-handed parallel beta-helix repeat-containing protein [Gilvimarinus sp. SDUM040013]MDO3386254.1 right-handed parallel beta-helix repeat-containing protein [Gilvimarinus sp. SDUM040013]MDX6849751.1 right-handed parallel beta-helix repeat-containing protein [Gilvimarinus sp. SDUM040013]
MRIFTISGKVSNALATVFACLLMSLANAQDLSNVTGFGMDTPAGEGGQVLKVTSLASEGEGTLRWALEQKGPRIVVFEVGGVIDLAGKGVRITEPYVTVAGQTAPSPGITLIRGGIGIATHDVRLQHLRVRPGANGGAARSGWEPDGIGISRKHARNIHIDHCSTSWAVDENMSASGERTEGPMATSGKITFSRSIIAEALDYATHKKGKHSKGILIHDYVQDIAVVGNLFAHNDRRNPYFKAHATGVVVNNYLYNIGNAAVQLGYIEDEWIGKERKPANPRVAVVGNELQYGRDTYSDLALVAHQGDVYLKDNRVLNLDGGDMAQVQGDIKLLDKPPVWPKGLEALPVAEVREAVLANAGARPWDRDAVDLRIVASARQGRGRIIDSEQDVGGYPKVTPTHRALQVPTKARDVPAWLASFIPAGYR